MKLIDVKQNSTEWLQARCGVFTASEFDNLVTPEFKPRSGETRMKYIYKKVAEKVMGYPALTGSSFAMDQGSVMEGEALPWFEFTEGIPVTKVGFCTSDDGAIGCSPDGLIGDDGGIECKCPDAHTHVAYLIAGAVPKDYLAQVHGSMLVTGRPWWIFLSYNRFFPPLMVKVLRDEEIIAKLSAALDAAKTDFTHALTRIRGLQAAKPGVAAQPHAGRAAV